MKEQMKRPKREDYGHAQAPILGFNAQTSKYILALEAYIDHLTAEQGGGKLYSEEYKKGFEDGKYAERQMQLDVSQQNSELTVREVVKWCSGETPKDPRWMFLEDGGMFASSHADTIPELTKIIRHQP